MIICRSIIPSFRTIYYAVIHVTLLSSLILTSSCMKREVYVYKGSSAERQGCQGAIALGNHVPNSIFHPLCSKDITEILRDSGLGAAMRGKITRLLCSRDSSPTEFYYFYHSMKDKERVALMQAFEAHGYYFDLPGCNDDERSNFMLWGM